jgi:peptide deformylase
MALKIAQLGQPILRQVAEAVPPAEITSPAFQQFLADMSATLREAKGIGLAAPQVFVNHRVFLSAAPPTNQGEPLAEPEVFINPRIVAVSPARTLSWEGCLSFVELLVYVPRHQRIRIEYLDWRGEPKTCDLEGFAARVAQHENDHLDGILTLDRAVSSRHIVKASEIEAVLEAEKKGEKKTV